MEFKKCSLRANGCYEFCIVCIVQGCCLALIFAFVYSQIFLISRDTFKIVDLMSFHAEKCCHQMSAHKVSARCTCSSVCHFLISSTFIFTCFFLVDEKKQDRHCVRSWRRQPHLCADNGTSLCSESDLHRHV